MKKFEKKAELMMQQGFSKPPYMNIDNIQFKGTKVRELMARFAHSIIKNGQISVNRKSLTEHCACLTKACEQMDEVMKDKENFDRGKKIAKIMNAITFTNHSIQHFELNVPLKKLK